MKFIWVALAFAIAGCIDSDSEPVLLAGETATMGEHDVGPRSNEALGGRGVAIGAPVYPENLLLLAKCQGRFVVGMPGCIRSRDTNVVDLLLPRLLAGQNVSRDDIAQLGCGGLLASNNSRLKDFAESRA